MNGKNLIAAEEKHLIPLDKVNGYDVRPGFYGINGATALREGVRKHLFHDRVRAGYL